MGLPTQFLNLAYPAQNSNLREGKEEERNSVRASPARRKRRRKESAQPHGARLSRLLSLAPQPLSPAPQYCSLLRLSRSAPQPLSPAPQSLRASATLPCASVLLFDSITASQSRYTLGRARINP